MSTEPRVGVDAVGDWVRLVKTTGADNAGVIEIDLLPGSLWKIIEIDNDGWLRVEHKSGHFRILAHPADFEPASAVEMLADLEKP